MIVRKSYNSKVKRLSQHVLSDIQQNQFPPGMLLPSEVDLANRYEVSRTTIRRVLDILINESVLVKLPHRGVLVPTDAETSHRISPSDVAGGNSLPASTGKRLLMAAVWSGTLDYAAAKALEGIQAYAEEHRLGFASYLSPLGHESTLSMLRDIASYPVDGVIVYPYLNKEYLSAIRVLTERHFPVVSLRSLDGLPLDTVCANDEAGAYQAVHFLIEKYHRPVYYLCEPKGREVCRERYAGYRSAMADFGFGEQIEVHTWRMDHLETDETHWSVDCRRLPGLHAAEVLLKEVSMPCSVFCLNDYMARGLYEAATKRGLRIGEDLAVVGFDDAPVAQMLDPGLTTIRTPTRANGYEAARLLHSLIGNRTREPASVRLPVELVVRGSTGKS